MSHTHKPLALFVAALAISQVIIPVAHARPNSNAYTCPALKDLVAQRGAVVLNTKSNSTYQVYGRFVANRSYCGSDEQLIGFKVPAKESTCKLKLCIKSDND